MVALDLDMAHHRSHFVYGSTLGMWDTGLLIRKLPPEQDTVAQLDSFV